MQQVLNNSISQRIVNDFVKFNWDWIISKQNVCKWGSLTSNLLLIAQEGITYLYYLMTYYNIIYLI